MELIEYWQDDPPVSESVVSLMSAFVERRPRADGIVREGPPSDHPGAPRGPAESAHMPAEQIAFNMRAMGGDVQPASALPPAVREAIAKFEAERAKASQTSKPVE
jgi:hypothetical protein